MIILLGFGFVLQGMMQERGIRPSGEDLLSCSRPLLERRLKPHPEQSLDASPPKPSSATTTTIVYHNLVIFARPAEGTGPKEEL